MLALELNQRKVGSDGGVSMETHRHLFKCCLVYILTFTFAWGKELDHMDRVTNSGYKSFRDN